MPSMVSIHIPPPLCCSPPIGEVLKDMAHIYQSVISRSIHPSILICLIRGRVVGAADPAGRPRLPSHPQHFPARSRGFRGVPRPTALSVLGLPRGLLPVGHTRNTSKGRHPGEIRIRCPNHLSWLLLTGRSSGSTPSSLLMSKLLNPYLLGWAQSSYGGNSFWPLESMISYQ